MSLHAQNATWTGNSSPSNQLWSDGTNWNNGVPSGVATFTSATAVSANIIDVNVATSIDRVTAQTGANHTITGSGILTIDSMAGNDIRAVAGSTLTFQNEVAASGIDAFQILSEAGSTVSLLGDYSSTNRLTIDGSGRVRLGAVVGTTGTIRVNSGSTLELLPGVTLNNSNFRVINGRLETSSVSSTTITTQNFNGNGDIEGDIITDGNLSPRPSDNTQVGETLTFEDNLTSSGRWLIDINESVSDSVAVGGSLDITGARLTVSSGAFTPMASVYIIGSYGAAGLTGTFTSNSTIPADYAIHYNYLGSNQIALVTTIPEPSALFPLFGLLLPAIMRRRRSGC